MGSLECRAARAFRDQLVKNAVMDLASEHFENGCYRPLVVAARRLGYPEIAELCEQNLRDEEPMARWLEQQVPVRVGHTVTATASRR